MNDFAHLISELDRTNKTNQKVDALVQYFNKANNKDKVWAIALFSHRRPKRLIKTTSLRSMAAKSAEIPLWLFEDSYHIVGDLAETISHLVCQKGRTHDNALKLHELISHMIDNREEDEEKQLAFIISQWKSMDFYSCFVFNKLITGGFRIGVSQKLMTRSLAKSTGIDEDVIAYRLMGDWDPKHITFEELILNPDKDALSYKPYPFYLAYALDKKLDELGSPKDWVYEYKWDGIRVQLIKRKDQVMMWSRGEELITNQFPEIQALKDVLANGTVLDGELLVYKENKMVSFNDLQKRLGRKNVGKKTLEQYPIVVRSYDLLEYNTRDLRNETYDQRRIQLESLVEKLNHPLIQLSDRYHIQKWEEVHHAYQNARSNRSEGLMLKQRNTSYKIGRKKGDWWKWKVEPLTIDAVLTYAMRGHGRRSNLFTDYTFALWKSSETSQNELVTFAKAYSGLTDAEFKEVDAFIKKNTLERFGPVRSVQPELVFEIAFEGVANSSRHKSGVAVRFPRILRWRKDKSINEANTVDDLKSLIPNE